jgi:hypothetical protein
MRQGKKRERKSLLLSLAGHRPIGRYYFPLIEKTIRTNFVALVKVKKRHCERSEAISVFVSA